MFPCSDSLSSNLQQPSHIYTPLPAVLLYLLLLCCFQPHPPSPPSSSSNHLEEGTGSGSKNSSGDNHHHININHATTGGGSKSLLDSANSSDDKGIGIRPGIVGSSTASFAPGYSHSNNNSVSGVGEDQGGGLLPGLKLRLPGHDNMAASSSSSASMMMLQQQGMHMLPGKRAGTAATPTDTPFCAALSIHSPTLKCLL